MHRGSNTLSFFRLAFISQGDTYLHWLLTAKLRRKQGERNQRCHCRCGWHHKPNFWKCYISVNIQRRKLLLGQILLFLDDLQNSSIKIQFRDQRNWLICRSVSSILGASKATSIMQHLDFSMWFARHQREWKRSYGFKMRTFNSMCGSSEKDSNLKNSVVSEGPFKFQKWRRGLSKNQNSYYRGLRDN